LAPVLAKRPVAVDTLTKEQTLDPIDVASALDGQGFALARVWTVLATPL
jgi:hypothetical protein